MISNDGSTNNENGGVGPSLRSLIALALVALIFYQIGFGRGRSEKSAKEYAALNAQYSDLRGEYDRAYAQYSAMKTQCEGTNAQYSALKAQYDRLEAKRAK